MRAALIAVSRAAVYASLVLGFLSLGASRAAAQTETTEYYAYDAVGSVRMVLSPTGAVLGQANYTPFGSEVGTTTGMPAQRFTSQERDSAAGLDHFAARSYAFARGRFTSPDPVGGNVSNPQSWNRYSYALNNPLSIIDPSGGHPDICIPSDGWFCSNVVCPPDCGPPPPPPPNWDLCLVLPGACFPAPPIPPGIPEPPPGGSPSPGPTGPTEPTPPSPGPGNPGNGNWCEGGCPPEPPPPEPPPCKPETRVTEITYDVSFMSFSYGRSLGFWEQTRESFFQFPRGGIITAEYGGVGSVGTSPFRWFGYGLSVNYTVANQTPDDFLGFGTSVGVGRAGVISGGIVASNGKIAGGTAGYGPGVGARMSARVGQATRRKYEWGSCAQ
jgi:RHS repeat-associated protein